MGARGYHGPSLEREKYRLDPELLGREVEYHRVFVTLTGNINAAIFLTQALGLSSRSLEPDGSFSLTGEEWEGLTGLSRGKQEGARKALRELDVLEERRMGLPARLWMRVNRARLQSLLSAGLGISFRDFQP